MDWLKLLWVFLVGGAICTIGQIFIDKTKITPARILVIYVVAGVVLSAIGVYKPLVELAGAGATIPLSGFGHSLAQGAIRAVEEKGLVGAMTGGLIATAAGIAAAVVFGYVNALIFSAKTKK